MRIYSTATTGQRTSWKREALHPTQFASVGEVLAACARIAWVTETSLVGICECWGISIDFAKMFNMLSPEVAIQVGLYMGLAPHYASLLAFPLLTSTGVWRLPFGAASWLFSSARGLPQGMSTSVLLAELAISPLSWRIHRVVPETAAIAYVDDLNLVAFQRHEMDMLVRLLRDFENDFDLQLSEAKTRVWASEGGRGIELQGAFGFQAANSLDALGAQWKVHRGSHPTYPKVHKRLDECIRRLSRTKALPLPIPRLAQIVSVGCLSLVEYLNLPEPQPYLKLRTLEKEVLGIRSAAPEVLMSVLQRTTLDPYLRWIVAALRLWFLVLKNSPSREKVNEVIEQANGTAG